MLRTGFVLMAVGLLLANSPGCGPATGTVSGKVLMDGQPLDKGNITFANADPAQNAPPVTAEIVNGSYSATMIAGKKFVQISAPVVVGYHKSSTGAEGPGEEMWDERLPDKYHAASTLELDVKPGGNTKDWETESIKGKRAGP